MSVTLKDNTLFTLVDILKDLLEECIITFTKTSVKIKTIDSMMVCLINVELNDVYDKCKLKNDEQICVNLSELNKIFGCKDKTDSCEIKFNEEFITIIYKNESHKSVDKYKLKLLYGEYEDIGDLEVEGNTQISMSSNYFSSLCKKLKKFDESIRIVTNKSNNDIHFKTGTEDAVDLTLIKNEDKLKDVTIQEDLNLRLLLKYLLLFSKGEKFTDTVIINIDEVDTPLEIRYEFNNNIISFLLSPQIEED